MLQSYNMWTRRDKNTLNYMGQEYTKHKSRRQFMCDTCDLATRSRSSVVWLFQTGADMTLTTSKAQRVIPPCKVWLLHLQVPTIAVLTFLMPKSWLAPNTGNYYTHIHLCGPFCVRRCMHTFLVLWRNPNSSGFKAKGWNGVQHV